MDQDRFSFRNLAINYLCLYAAFYPLLTHFLMEEGGTGGLGSVPIHFFQLSALVAILGLAKLGSRSFRNCVDVWIVASIYFACDALYLAVFFAENSKIVEIAYAARFIMWFLFATIITRNSLDFRQLEKLSFSFLVGIFIQGLLAIWAFNTQSVGSIYKEVYATTGGVNVSGKTVVSFVTLGIFLSFYWLVTTRRVRWIYVIPILVGMLVILFSYNRAFQLSFALVLLFDAFWLFRGRKIRAFLILGFAVILIGVFLNTTFGESFLLRWQRIRYDGGNGRMKLIRAALEAFTNPESMRSLLFGRGYLETRLLMFRACGDDVGTHSDLFDFLTMYGLVGGVFYGCIAFRILTMGKELPRRSLEYFCVRSTGVMIILAGLMTGSFQATYTYVMFFTLVQYWIEKSRYLYGIGEQSSVVGSTSFMTEPLIEDEDFSDFGEPDGDCDVFSYMSNRNERETDELYEQGRTVWGRHDSDNFPIEVNGEADVDQVGEVTDRRKDFKTIYSVVDSTLGSYLPSIMVENQSQNIGDSVARNLPSHLDNDRLPSASDEPE